MDIKYKINYLEQAILEIHDHYSKMINEDIKMNRVNKHSDKFLDEWMRVETTLSMYPEMGNQIKKITNLDVDYRWIRVISTLWFIYFVKSSEIWIDSLIDTRMNNKGIKYS